MTEFLAHARVLTIAPDEPAVHFSTLNARYGHALSVGPAAPSGMLWLPPYARGFGRRVGLQIGGGPGDAGCPA